jgi:hypothetical protein
MAKDKKKKKDKKSGSSKASDGLKALAKNPMVADVVAAALVATASALKDSKRARALASEAGDELGKLSKAGAEAGNALWDMALQIGRRSLEALTNENPPKASKSKPGEASKPKVTAKTKAPARKTNTKKQPARAARK